MTKQTIECPKCAGAGFIAAFGHVANGVCFCCKGNKTIEVDAVELKAKLNSYTIKTADWIMKAKRRASVALCLEDPRNNADHGLQYQW